MKSNYGISIRDSDNKIRTIYGYDTPPEVTVKDMIAFTVKNQLFYIPLTTLKKNQLSPVCITSRAGLCYLIEDELSFTVDCRFSSTTVWVTFNCDTEEQIYIQAHIRDKEYGTIQHWERYVDRDYSGVAKGTITMFQDVNIQGCTFTLSYTGESGKQQTIVIGGNDGAVTFYKYR